MKSRNFIFFTLLLFIGGCQETVSKRENDLVALLSSSAETIQVGQQLTLSSSLKNNSDKQIAISSGLSIFLYSIFNEKNEDIYTNINAPSIVNYKIDPHQSKDEQTTYTFKEPGKYLIVATARFHLKNNKNETELKSNKIEIIVD